MQDRCLFARYVMTGQLPVDPPGAAPGSGVGPGAVASVTMLGRRLPGLPPRSAQEVFFYALPMACAVLPSAGVGILRAASGSGSARQDQPGGWDAGAPAAGPVMEASMCFLRTGLARLRHALASGALLAEVHHQALLPSDSALHARIRTAHAPSSMSWSNIADYMPPERFHAMAAACSASGGTVHTLHAMNWVQQVSSWEQRVVLCAVLPTTHFTLCLQKPAQQSPPTAPGLSLCPIQQTIGGWPQCAIWHRHSHRGAVPLACTARQALTHAISKDMHIAESACSLYGEHIAVAWRKGSSDGKLQSGSLHELIVCLCSQVWGLGVPEVPVPQRMDAYRHGLRSMGEGVASSDPNGCLVR